MRRLGGVRRYKSSTGPSNPDAAQNGRSAKARGSLWETIAQIEETGSSGESVPSLLLLLLISHHNTSWYSSRNRDYVRSMPLSSGFRLTCTRVLLASLASTTATFDVLAFSVLQRICT